MTPELWATVNEVLAGALELEPGQRTSFVDLACGADDTLRKEVLSLLALEGRIGSVLRRPLLDSTLNLWSFAPPAPSVPAVATAPAHTARRDDARPAARPPFVWVAWAIGLVFLLLYAHAARTIYTLGDTTIDFGWQETAQGGGWVVETVDPAGPAALALQPGDEILAFNGDPRARLRGARSYRRYLRPGADYTVRVARPSDDQRDYSLRVSTRKAPGSALTACLYLALSIAFCLMAVAMGLLKPQDRVPQLGCLAGALSALPVLAPAFNTYRGLQTGAAFVLSDAPWLLDQLYLAVAFHFFLSLSYAGAQPRAWAVVRRVLYVVCTAQVAVNLLLHIVSYTGHANSIRLADAAPWLVSLANLLFRSNWWVGLQILAYGSICAVLAGGYHQARSSDQRQRIAWVVFGALVGLAPALLYFIASLGFALAGRVDLLETRFWAGASLAATSCLIAIPSTLAYAVVRHRVMNIRVVVRRTLQYALATRVLQAVLLLPVAGLCWPLITNRDRTVAELFPPESLYFNASLFVALMLALKFRLPLQSWLDRRFFRDARRREALLRDLASGIKDVDNVQDLARRIGTQVSDALQPTFACVYHRRSEHGPLVLGHLAGEMPGGIRSLAAIEVARVSATGLEGPTELAFAVEQGSEEIQIGLLVPVHDQALRLKALLVLGGRKSEEAYTSGDRQLLQAVAEQVGLAHENILLRERVAEAARVQIEVLAHLPDGGARLLLECPACGLCYDGGRTVCGEDGTTLERLMPINRRISERYRLDRRIGEGGMGAVYEAMDLQLQRTVAAKVMLGELWHDRLALRRFEREARAVARLSHPHIVTVHDFGRTGTKGAYLIMERVYGTTWRAELRRRTTVPLSLLRLWLEQLLDALEAAHAAGVIHRDLKPENILIVPDVSGHPQLKIVDFGLAKLQAGDDGGSGTLTRQGCAVGTLGYMAPELLRGERSDERGDLFAVGVMLVEAITGRPPFVGTSPGAVLGAIEHFRLAFETAHSPALRSLTRNLERCLRYQPSDRYQSVAEMRGPLLASLQACESLFGASTDRASVLS